MNAIRRLVAWLRRRVVRDRQYDEPIVRGVDDGDDSGELAEREWRERYDRRPDH